MNGVHDMGGMDGMGPIHEEKNEPVFHEPWEGRVFALRRAMGAWGKWDIDVTRYEVELVPPVEYLRMSYYSPRSLRCWSSTASLRARNSRAALPRRALARLCPYSRPRKLPC